MREMKVAFTEKNEEMIPFANDDKYVILSSMFPTIEDDYYVIGYTIDGAKFISEKCGWSKACELFKEYKRMVGYFGGGITALYVRSDDKSKLIFDEVCF